MCTLLHISIPSMNDRLRRGKTSSHDPAFIVLKVRWISQHVTPPPPVETPNLQGRPSPASPLALPFLLPSLHEARCSLVSDRYPFPACHPQSEKGYIARVLRAQLGYISAIHMPHIHGISNCQCRAPPDDPHGTAVERSHASLGSRSARSHASQHGRIRTKRD